MPLKPGMQLRLDDGRTFLVGDINTYGGLCDDCMLDGTVVAWRRLLTQNQLDG